MAVLPDTRCPDCGTICTARLCPACLFELWEHVFRFIDPDGHEALVDIGGLSRTPTSDGLMVLAVAESQEAWEAMDFSPLFGGRPVQPIGDAWIRFDSITLDVETGRIDPDMGPREELEKLLRSPADATPSRQRPDCSRETPLADRIRSLSLRFREERARAQAVPSVLELIARLIERGDQRLTLLRIREVRGDDLGMQSARNIVRDVRQLFAGECIPITLHPLDDGVDGWLIYCRGRSGE